MRLEPSSRRFQQIRRRGTRLATGFAVALVMAAMTAPAIARVDPYEQGRALYGKNRLQDALPFLEQAAAAKPRDADVLALLAETYRRLGHREEAERTGRMALAVAPCHAFALSVVGDNFNPQFGDWGGANADSAWTYLRASVACDPAEGNAWQGIVIEAMRRDDFDVERNALRQLMATGFLTPPLLAFGRWLLRALPDRAVLLVNGDMDTYPPLALQEIEGFRPDVVIVNLSLLELDWYRRLVRDRYRVPMPFDREDLDQLEPIRGPQGTWIYAPKRVVRGWFAMLEAGTFGRPLAVAVTVADRDFSHDAWSREVLTGSFWLVVAESTGTLVDTTRVRASLVSLKPKEFAGPWLSDRNRSPVLRASNASLSSNILWGAAEYFAACQEAGRVNDAHAMQAWASDFAREAEVDPIMRVAIGHWSTAGFRPSIGR